VFLQRGVHCELAPHGSRRGHVVGREKGTYARRSAPICGRQGLNDRFMRTTRVSGRSFARDRERSGQKRAVSRDDFAVKNHELPLRMSRDRLGNATRGDRE
jgi:hypothetical protein